MSFLRPLFALYSRALQDEFRARFPAILRTSMLLFLLGMLWMNELILSTQKAAGYFLLSALATLNFAGITVLGLARFCSAITEEKEDGTLALLRMTRLNPFAILIGKSTARLTSGLLFLAVQFPFSLLCVTLGGVAIMQVIRIYVILAAYLFFLCNFGLFFSVVARHTFLAIVWTFFLGLLAFLVAPILRDAWFSSPSSNSFLAQLTTYLVWVNPVRDYQEAITTKAVHVFYTASTPFMLNAGTVSFLAAWVFFNRCCGGDLAPVKVGAKRRTTPYRAWRPALLWKDFYFAAGGWTSIVLTMAVCGSLVAATAMPKVAGFLGPWSREADGQALRVFGFIGFAIGLLLAASAVFGRERREHTLGTLWMLPHPTIRLIWQKAAGYLLVLFPMAILWWVGWFFSPDRSLYLSPSEVMLENAHRFHVGVQLIVSAIFIAYLSLRLRRGALVMGFMSLLIWNFSTGYIIARVMSQRGSGDFANGQMADMTYRLGWGLILIGIALLIILPRRLAECAGED